LIPQIIDPMPFLPDWTITHIVKSRVCIFIVGRIQIEDEFKEKMLQTMLIGLGFMAP